MADLSMMKLGKQAARRDNRSLAFAAYAANLASAPDVCNNTDKITNLGMMLNDTLGDCTCATVGHIIQAWTAECGAQIILPDSVILALYEKFGYDPNDPSTDGGAVILDVIKLWRTSGVEGHTIGAFAVLNTARLQEFKDGVYYFGSVYIGVQLPITAQNQDIWDVVPNGGANAVAGSWGGHAIPIVAYDGDFWYVITWGAIKKVTTAFLQAYCDEGYVPFSNDILDKTSGKSPEGFDQDSLILDLKLVTSA